jgi:superoxide dismutase, Fe-Mn family
VRSSGSATLCFRPGEGRLANVAHVAHAADEAGATSVRSVPLLTLAPPAPAGHALDAWFEAVDWSAVYERYQAAVHAASEACAATQDEVRGTLLLDVRRAGIYEQATQIIDGARWRDPAQVAQWARELPAEREVVVYCIYGHEVGRATALRLRAAGINARFLQGGFDAWKTAGRPLAAKPQPEPEPLP